MKKLNPILLVLLTFGTTSCAQVKRTTISYKDFDASLPVNGDLFIKNENLEKFLGKYVWEENNVKMAIDFKKTEGPIPYDNGTMTLQTLRGEFIIIKKGQRTNLDFYLGGVMLPSEDDIVTFQYSAKFHSSVIYELVFIDSTTLLLRKGKRSGEFTEVQKQKIWLPESATLKKQN